MAKHRVHSQDALDDGAGDRGSPRSPAKRRRGSWLVWFGSRLLVVVILLAALVFFAPLVIASTGLWKPILAAVVPPLAGKIDAAALKLAWLSPIEVKGLVVRDAAGQTLAEVPAVRSRKTLLQIALNHRDLGGFEVQEPKARIVLRADGSNVEDFLAKLPKTESQSGAIALELQLARGAVGIDDQIARRQWQLEDLALDVVWTAAADQPKTGKLSAVLKPVGNPAAGGELAAEFSWQPGAGEKPTPGSGQVQVALAGLPTEAAQGALRRFVTDIRPQGPLSVQAAYGWAEEGKSQHLVLTKLATPGLSVAAPAWLGRDQPTVVISSGQADVQIAGGKAIVRQLRLDSNLVQVEGRATADVGWLAAAVSPSQGAAAGDDVQLEARIDLAELARHLPATLRLRDGTQLRSGALQLSLAGRSQGGGRRWDATVQTTKLEAMSDGHPIVFEQPLTVNLALQQAADGLVIERLDGRASFLSLRGQGSLAGGSITARADLNNLVAELGRLIDWGQTRLAGSVDAQLRWSRGESDRWNATADGLVKDFELGAPGLAPWKEPGLHLVAETLGSSQQASLDRIDAAKLTVESGADRLDAELIESVKLPTAGSTFPIKFNLRGDLASWAPRLQPLVPLGGWRMAGAIDASGSGRFSQQASEVGPTTVRIEQLAVEGPGLSIREPIVKLETAGAWDQAKATVTLGGTTLASSSLALRADGLRIVASQQPSIVGLIDFRGDLGKLSGWLANGGQPRTWQASGALTGRVEITYRGQALAANWVADAENLAYLVAPGAQAAGTRAALAAAPMQQAWQPMWEEPRLNFAGQGMFDPATGMLSIERTSLAVTNASVAATGVVKRLASQPEVDLSGEIAYSLEGLTQQIQALAQRRQSPGKRELPYGLGTLQLTGKERRQFVLKGPLLAASNLTPAGSRSTASPPPTGPSISDALAGEASLGWHAAQYVGLVAGPADFRARLTGGTIQIGPLDIPLSEGRLTTAPRILLNDRVPAVIVERGPLIQNVRISPEMCSLWLKFVAPLVAEATRAEGTFSLSLQGAAVPLAAPLASDVAGTLAIHSAQIGPGPLAQQYLATARQLRTFFESNAPDATAVDPNRGWLVLPQQDVTFEVKDGAVHHRGLTMTVKDVVITTQGSVGIETQEINLLASIPIQESWLKRQDGVFAGLKGKTLQIPIRGTLSQPKLDGRVLENLGKQLVGSAVQGQIEKQLERGQGLLQRELGQGLNKLFGPQQPQPSAPQPPPSPAPRR